MTSEVKQAFNREIASSRNPEAGAEKRPASAASVLAKYRAKQVALRHEQAGSTRGGDA